jgi:Ca2+-binding EF-hand superfamily protein
MSLILAEDEYDTVAGNLSEETKLPRELIRRFCEMWYAREQPFFSAVTEEGVMPRAGLQEVVRTLKVSSPMLCKSIARVISQGEPAISFEMFVRGYAKMHSRTLKEALPFAFAVCDLDGDGFLEQDEFRSVLDANLTMQQLDPAAINRVLAADTSGDTSGVTYDSFRYFASLTSETILATCGFLLHVRDFFVPLTPLGTEEEEEREERELQERIRREREREHAPKTGDAAGGAADADATDEVAHYFSDPEILEALEAMRTTPEERALRSKDKGNDALKHGKGGILKAIQHYTEGLDERCEEAPLNATLHANRAAAELMLKNWGKALADVLVALGSGALPAASVAKVARRGASAAVKVGKLDEAERLLSTGEEALSTGAPEKGAEAEAAEMAKLRATVAEVREERRQKALVDAAYAHQRKVTAEAITRRGYDVGDFVNETLRAQCVGETAGARVWYDDEADELHWPLLLLYPEPAQSDFIQDVCEADALQPHLVEMFGEHGELAPPWDTEGKYAVERLVAYAAFPDPEGDGAAEVAYELAVHKPLLAQLLKLQPVGYRIPGIPMVTVLVRGSEYERLFLLPKVRKAP